MSKPVLGLLIGSSAFASLGYVLGDEKQKRRLNGNIQATYRITNLISTVASISTDYGYHINFESSEISSYNTLKLRKLSTELRNLQTKQEVDTLALWNSKDKFEIDSYQKIIQSNREHIDTVSEAIAIINQDNQGLSSLSKIHTRSAIKLCEMCMKNKGVYIKLGQHISMLDHIIPVEYQMELSKLLANNPHSSLESIRRVIKEDLGKDIDEIFINFDVNPIASASLAQVHIAYDKEGKKYAVKIQHEGLLEGSEFDMKVITYLIDLLSKIFVGFDYNWVAREMNINLPKELNFQNEIQNMLKCAKLLNDMIITGDVCIPKPNELLSSQRVLTMDFEEGCYVSDLDKIEEIKLHTPDIARLISTVFAEQIFRHGFVHCGSFSLISLFLLI